MRVRAGGWTRVPVFQKAYFQILFIFTKDRKDGKPRIEFSPANKKRRERVLSRQDTHRIFSRH